MSAQHSITSGMEVANERALPQKSPSPTLSSKPTSVPGELAKGARIDVTGPKKRARLPEAQESAFIKAYEAFQAAKDPHDQWANRKLATVIHSLQDAGWPRRTIADSLGITPERVRKLVEYEPTASLKFPKYEQGATFPKSAQTAFRKREDDVNLRTLNAERKFLALLRSAHAAGWPFPQLARIVGISGERMRQIYESDVSVEDMEMPEIEAYVRPVKAKPQITPKTKLTEAEKKKFRRLAEIAAKTTKSTGKNLGPNPTKEEKEEAAQALKVRRASEELSALIIDAKNRNVSWPDLDEACGYRRGAARARASRHGFGKLPPSMKAYTKTSTTAYEKVAVPPPSIPVGR